MWLPKLWQEMGEGAPRDSAMVSYLLLRFRFVLSFPYFSGLPSFMDHPTLSSLVEHLHGRLVSLRPGEPFWLGIAGAPGSGKSTLAAALAERMTEVAVVIPMDGYHFTRAELDAMPDPDLAHLRRGAPFTFDAERFVADLVQARESGTGRFPSFDHGAGDPVEGNIELIPGQHRLVIVEGNYVLLDEEPWCRLSSLFDESWYLDVDIDLCMSRVKDRMLATGRSEEIAGHRIDQNDRPNAGLIASTAPERADRCLAEVLLG